MYGDVSPEWKIALICFKSRFLCRKTETNLEKWNLRPKFGFCTSACGGRTDEGWWCFWNIALSSNAQVESKSGLLLMEVYGNMTMGKRRRGHSEVWSPNMAVQKGCSCEAASAWLVIFLPPAQLYLLCWLTSLFY